MKLQEIKSCIYEIIEKETGKKATEIDPDADIRDQFALDSMQLVGIIARIEDKIGIELPIQIMEVNTLKEFFNFLEKLIKDQKNKASPEA